ncbi:MAG: hypothetical protein MUE40_02025 [Anaerolineae bacterium]|jgi:cytochrome c-type biogenesis protein|nr:hypothetical protein [Anaerolineae bacterium]
MNELLAGFSAGSLASLTNACLLPLYPGLIAFLAGRAGDERSRRVAALLGIPVLAGVLTTMTAVGLVLVLLSSTFDAVLPLLLPLIYAVVILMGLLLLAGKNPFATLQQLPAPVFRNPFATAYAYGLLLGPMTLPCTGPVLVGAFAFSAGITDVLNGLLYFLAFGLGFGWILVVLPLFALPLQRRLVGWLTTHHHILNVASGLLLIAVGVFGILTELLPRWIVDFYPGPTEQALYWLVTLLIVVGAGVWLYRRPAPAES